MEPMELGHLPYKKGTYEDYVGRAGLKRHGKQWQRDVADVVSRLIAALEPDDTVLGGGNVKKLEVLPPHCRAGDITADFGDVGKFGPQIGQPHAVGQSHLYWPGRRRHERSGRGRIPARQHSGCRQSAAGDCQCIVAGRANDGEQIELSATFKLYHYPLWPTIAPAAYTFVSRRCSLYRCFDIGQGNLHRCRTLGCWHVCGFVLTIWASTLKAFRIMRGALSQFKSFFSECRGGHYHRKLLYQFL
jgi:hypothetical protein